MLLNRHRKTKVEDVNVGDLEKQANTTKKTTETPKQVKKTEKGDK
ncbi:hypothetical protein QH639_14870 [Lysinibacillus sp. 1 U-2021]|nr:hypothetical protein [Lysinibacillus sp. 1 U-2021]WGT37128.1 hypothetical protein QH639_14870 [Lysinibacillus sp. 1 U-2021]